MNQTSPSSQPTPDSSRKMLQALKQMRGKLEALTQAQTEPIAIIGLGCRFPGGAKDSATYWHLLEQGIDAISEVPGDRWNLEDYYDPEGGKPGKTYTKEGGFIENVDRFDPHFFRISPRDAVGLDPQQRILLEVTWESLENAGVTLEHLRHSQTGVYMGICTDDYASLRIQYQEQGGTDESSGLGMGRSIGVGRISHFLGLQGPNIQLDTACSTSLVAIHLACQSLRSRESNLALAGGVNLILSPTSTIGRCQLNMLSRDGRCKTFDASADGYGQGEGCGVVVLKRLSDALADGDFIWGLIRGSAINHDGPSSGMTVPSRMAQKKVIQEALKSAKLSPHQVSYVETHGTGTSLGDPIEIEALSAIYGKNRSQENPLMMGSVKTNFGHLEAAAGVAALIKVILSLQHRQIPPHLHIQQPNPHIDWDRLPLKIPQSLLDWETESEPRIAGISSFGASGTNAHILVEETPVKQPEKSEAEDSSEPPVQLLTLSTKTPKALGELVHSYQDYLSTYPELDLANLAYTTHLGRSHFNHRLALITSSHSALQQQLHSYLLEPAEAIAVYGAEVSTSTEPPEIAFLFTGQGSQYVNMGRQLYESSPVFREAIAQCNTILGYELDRPLLEILYPDSEAEPSPLLDRTAYTQPALFALEYALFKLWQSWGIQPRVVMGHSVGEYVAACVAGVFSLEDGLRLMAARGRLIQNLPQNGLMAAVKASESDLRPRLLPYQKQAAIAAINGPESVVISGEKTILKDIVEQLESEGIKTQNLPISHAFHSPLIEPILAEFRAVAQQIAYHPPQIPFVSNVTGEQAGEAIATAHYWVDHLRQPVKFASAMTAMQDYPIFLELGPKPILLGMGRSCVSDDRGMWLPSLRPGIGDWQQMLSSLGQLYTQGVEIDWSGFHHQQKRHKVFLPTYPFQRQRYWLEQPKSAPHQPSWGSLGSPQELSALTERLQKKGSLSETELKLMPKLLELLAQEANETSDRPPILEECYGVQWRCRACFGSRFSGENLQSPPILQAQLVPQLSELANRPALQGYDKIPLQLEHLAREYIVQALQTLGWCYESGESFSLEQLAAQLGIIPAHHRLLKRLLVSLEEAQILHQTAEEWETLKSLPPVSPSSTYQTLRDRYPQAIAEFSLLHRCASQLSSVLQGTQDPVQLVFPEGDLTGATQLYQDSPVSQAMNSLVQQAIASLLETLPPSQGIRILEIGAGTGGTTSAILPTLPPSQIQYTFTDLGPLFLTKAKEKFSDYPFITYQTLDIEQNPASQRFPNHHYDLIIAANVLHATSNIRHTLTHVRQLLAPGGLLLLLEATEPQQWVDLIFGLLEGWWKFSDTEYRRDHPLLNRHQWQHLLQETGFTPVSSLPQEAKVDDVLSKQALILAQADSEPRKPNATSQSWLIFADRTGVAQTLAAQLEDLAATCILVGRGDNYQRIAPKHWQIDPHNPQDFRKLMAEVAIEYPQLSGIVQCWTLEPPTDSYLSLEDLNRLSELGCGTTLSLVQAIIEQERFSPQLQIVTQGSQSALHHGGQPPGIAQSSLWGMAKAIRLEHPELSCRVLDLDPQTSLEEQATSLLQELGSSDSEDQVVWREQVRYVPRLVKTSSESTSGRVKLRSDATYLITGGLGGLGLLVADWMIERGAQHLVLVTRRPADPATQAKLTQLEQKGCSIRVEIADVANFEAIQAVFNTMTPSSYPLAGIIHAAGMLSDGVLKNQTWSSFEAVMAPKVQGAWILHQLTQHQSLDFFVLFSSVGSLFGSPGQGNHSAANAFLDALAHYRQGIGLPGLSIHWGAVSQVGEAAERGADVRVKQKGMEALSPDEVLKALEHWMGSAQAEVGVVSMEWAAWEEQVRTWPFLSDWQKTDSLISAPSKASILQQLEMALPSEQQDLLIAHIRHQVAQVLGIEKVESISLKEGFFDLGMDSLTSVELKNKLQTSLGCSLPSSLMFDYPTVSELVNYLAGHVLDSEGDREEVPTTEKFAPPWGEKGNRGDPDLEEDSDEDVELSLLNKLDQLGY
ncbi:MAG: SDR family NAD(P)-dependent oxidoreductase [Roseofilum sp. Belize BBD 4]|uniref:type I polyketide synthase n=1 Tax=Roseofilum sp. Belize BBD 4 TaxID=2821500 RepID=UPI001B134C21|nr:type I polyketide synthase [Roseofilum sp. Belize BBD 4]MBP0032421.1 SDR family NAD(P)-dependent oxidoreductase [Roseofilum sp. Belize BBD 4]